MVLKDLILDASYTPTFEELQDYTGDTAKGWWQELDTFIRQNYKASPRTAYSSCSGKPGWNVKYQRSGKSFCTLYPEKDGFVVLIVILLDMVPVIEGMARAFEPEIVDMVRNARPFNGTKWLMIKVDREAVLENIKRLMRLKYEMKL